MLISQYVTIISLTHILCLFSTFLRMLARNSCTSACWPASAGLRLSPINHGYCRVWTYPTDTRTLPLCFLTKFFTFIIPALAFNCFAYCIVYVCMSVVKCLKNNALFTHFYCRWMWFVLKFWSDFFRLSDFKLSGLMLWALFFLLCLLLFCI